MADSRRFGVPSLATSILSVTTEKQFCCVFVGGRALFLAYRGTDHTLVGWKEDFVCLFSVIARRDAVNLERAHLLDGRFRLGGHSRRKPRHLRRLLFRRYPERIGCVYSNDSPVFFPTCWQARATKDSQIRSFVPQSSIVGMLLDRGRLPVHSTRHFFSRPLLVAGGANRLRHPGRSHRRSHFESHVEGWIADMGGKSRAFINALYASSRRPTLELSRIPTEGGEKRRRGDQRLARWTRIQKYVLRNPHRLVQAGMKNFRRLQAQKEK